MPVAFVGVLTTWSTSPGEWSDVPAHSQEQNGDLVIQAWWLPTTSSNLTPNTSGWTTILDRDTTSAAPFAMWMFRQPSAGQTTRWDWNGSTSLWGAIKLIVRGADPDDPIQVGPLLSGGTSGATLTVPSMTPTEPGGMAVHFLTTRYTSSSTDKSIGDLPGYTMATSRASQHSAGHVMRMGRRDNVLAGSPTGVQSASASADTSGWGAISVVLREPRPETSLNRQFHVLA